MNPDKFSTGSKQQTDTSRWSLQIRLSLFFTAAITLAWLFSAAFAWYKTAKYIDEFFDTRQLLFARRIAASGLDFAHRPEGIGAVFSSKKAEGDPDDDALAFAIFSPQGELLLSDGEKGKDFIFSHGTAGFEEACLAGDDDLWRIIWQPSENGRFIVAVGQEVDYRQEMTLKLLKKQIMPWAVMLPLLLLGLIWMLRQELAPLRLIRRELETRRPGNPAPLAAENMPPEIRPLVLSLNSHFERVASLLERERAFTANAAHELRTPLAGLRIQAEVAGLSKDDPAALHAALQNLISGIDRSSRLADQLLALSRIDAMQPHTVTGKNEAAGHIQWQTVIHDVLAEYASAAQKKHLSIIVSIQAEPPAVKADPALPYMLIRNLLDNAVRYAPKESEIRLALNGQGLTMENSGPALPDTVFSRLGERFYRPPGQEATGSGLGLSIVRELALLLGMSFSLSKKETDNPAQMQYRFLLKHIR